MVIKQILLAFCLGAILAASATAGSLAQFRTVFGTLEVELYDQEKPVTTENFKRLVRAGVYEDTFFHRLIPGFVAQGGSYVVTDTFSSNLFAPPWLELGLVPSFGPITNEYGVGPMLSNTNGTLAMAKVEGNPNSATSGWFFSLANNSAILDSQNGGFTVFGRVIRDANNLMGFFNGRSYGNGMQNMSAFYPGNTTASNFSTLPVNYGGAAHPAYWNLLFVDISLLEVAITQTNGLPLISWTAVAGKTNYVEYTTNMPPQWQSLYPIVPGPGRVGVIDNTGGSRKFYRVRVAY